MARLGGLHGAVLASGRADAHERRPGTLHDGLDVGEVEVDQSRRRDEVGDALDTGEQDLVGAAERVEHRDGAVADRQQPVVGDDDEGVDLLAEVADAGLGLVGATTALEGERARDDTDRQGTEPLGDARDDRGASGAGATTLTRGDEDHVGPLEDLFDLLGVVLGGLLADLGVGACAETAGEPRGRRRALTSASLMRSACASVLIAMNSTPLRPTSIIRLMALTPPPPMPTTLMTAK